jgi:hypothetical protein
MPTEYIKTQMQLYPAKYGKEGVMYCVRDTVKNHGVLGTSSFSFLLSTTLPFICLFCFFYSKKSELKRYNRPKNGAIALRRDDNHVS